MIQGQSERVAEILSWYRSENNGVLTNLQRLLMSGTLAGTGKLVILPVDQGFEHGPLRSFLPNSEGFDPRYHLELAIAAGCNAYAAPFGQIAAAYYDYIGRIPLIVKLNNSDTLYTSRNPDQAVTCSVPEALRMGATAVGFTIYPGTSHREGMYEEVRELAKEARSLGLPMVVWSYPRGEGLAHEDETAVDVVAYAAHIACQLGAHIVKVKPPTNHIAQEAARKIMEKERIKLDLLSERVSLVVKSCFGGRRIVIFSGGETKSDTEVLEEVRSLHTGGAFGSIMGRNAFQRPMEEGVRLLKQVMEVFAGRS